MSTSSAGYPRAFAVFLGLFSCLAREPVAATSGLARKTDGVADDPAITLTKQLVSINTVNPSLVKDGAGERAVVEPIVSRLEGAGLEVTVTWPAPGRPNVVGVARGSGGGRTLLLLGHTDTVSSEGVSDPSLDGGILRGRGAYDMKSGLAAAIDAAASVPGLAGDVIVAAVCDEEAGGLGTRSLLETGPVADAAVVTEPTDLKVGVAHKGFCGFEIRTKGRAAHGSAADPGADAIVKMAPVLQGLGQLEKGLEAGRQHPLLGRGSVHASLIRGGQEASSYPAECVLTGEWRTVPGEAPEAALSELIRRSGTDAELRVTYTGPAMETSQEEEIVAAFERVVGTGVGAMPYWADSALLAAAGIPTVLFGPLGGGAHALDEWVDLSSVVRVRDALVDVATEFCRPSRP